jgi:energy-converting hydrogenase A subunit M
MSKEKKAIRSEVATMAETARNVKVAKAFAMRLEGVPVDDIAFHLEVSPLEVQELVRVAYGKLSTQSAEEARAEVEARLDVLLRKVHRDIELAGNQPERTALYRVLLSIERERATLLGLDIPKGVADA